MDEGARNPGPSQLGGKRPRTGTRLEGAKKKEGRGARIEDECDPRYRPKGMSMRGTGGFLDLVRGGIVGGGERKEKREKFDRQVIIREGEEGKVTVELPGQNRSLRLAEQNPTCRMVL